MAEGTVYMLGADTDVVVGLQEFAQIELEGEHEDKEVGLRIKFHVHGDCGTGECKTLDLILRQRATLELLKCALEAAEALHEEDT